MFASLLLRSSFLFVLAQAFTIKRRGVFSSSRWAQARALHASAQPGDEVVRMLSDMTEFYSFMVDEQRRRFYYECRQGQRVHQVHPIRDLAAAWDTTKALQFWKEHPNKSLNSQNLDGLERAVVTTLQSYSTCALSSDKGLVVSGLPEPANIAHSALTILASAGAVRLSLVDPSSASIRHMIDGLTRGILAMQQDNGAFQIEFNNPESLYQGIDFYPGEAMLALMEVHNLSLVVPGVLDPSTQNRILPSLHRAFEFYSTYYRQANPDINYNIWQIQAFSQLHGACSMRNPPALIQYIADMCQDIVSSKAWKYELARGRSFYPNLQTVEIACGLDALVDGIRVLTESPGDNQPVELLARQAQNAVDFLGWSLDQVPAEVKGGLGYGGINVMDQRLDVTGHAISALRKWHETGQKL